MIPLQFSEELPDFNNFSCAKSYAVEYKYLATQKVDSFCDMNQEKKFHNYEIFSKLNCMISYEMFNLSRYIVINLYKEEK